MKRVLVVFLAVMMVVSTMSFAIPSAVIENDSAAVVEETVLNETAELAETQSTDDYGKLLYRLHFDNTTSSTSVASGWNSAASWGSDKDSSIATDGRVWLVSSGKAFTSENSEHNGFLRLNLPFSGNEICDYHPQTTAIQMKKGVTYTFTIDVRANAYANPSVSGTNALQFLKTYTVTENVAVNVPNDNAWHTYAVQYTPAADELWGTSNGDYIYLYQASYMSVSGAFDIDNICIYEQSSDVKLTLIESGIQVATKYVSPGSVKVSDILCDVDLDDDSKQITGLEINGVTYSLDEVVYLNSNVVASIVTNYDKLYGKILYRLHFDNTTTSTAGNDKGGWSSVATWGSYKDSAIANDGRFWLVSNGNTFATEAGLHKSFMRISLPFKGDEIFNYHPQYSDFQLKKGVTYTFSFDARANASYAPTSASGKNIFYLAREYVNIKSINVNIPNDNTWHTYSITYTPEADEVWGKANGDYLFFFQNSYMSSGSGTFDIDNVTIYEKSATATVNFTVDGKVIATKSGVSTVGVTFEQLISDVEFNGYSVPTAITYKGVTYSGAAGEDKIYFTQDTETVIAESIKISDFAPTTHSDADIRIDTPIGIRFKADMKSADNTVKQAGWIVTRKAFLDYANLSADSFNMTSDVKMATGYNIKEGQADSIFSTQNNVDTLSAVLIGIPKENYGDVVVAKPFVVDSEGTWYGKAYVGSPKEVALQVLSNGEPANAQHKAVLEEIAEDRFTYITLQKQKDKDFVVLNLTDSHLNLNEWQSNSDNLRHYKATVNELVNRVNPDLITLSGDLGNANGDVTPYECYRDYIDSFGIPWSYTNGNHDLEYGDEFANKIIDAFMMADNFIFESKDKSFGITNYVICIEQEGEIIHSVLLMDMYDRIVVTKDDAGNELKSWKSFNPLQHEWYEETIAELEALGCGESTLITHVPIRGYKKAFDAAFNQNYDPKNVTLEQSYNGDCWNEGYKNSYGVAHENVTAYSYEDNMIETMQRLGNTKAVLCGHDHINNFHINYLGIDLVYSLKTGHSGLSEYELNGGTTVTIDQNGVGTVNHEYVYPQSW